MAKPSWLSRVCELRDELRHYVFLWEKEGQQCAGALLFASQKPQNVVLAKLEVFGAAYLACGMADAVSPGGEEWYEFTFKFALGQFYTQCDLPRDEREIEVLPNVFVRAQHAVSLADKVGLATWLEANKPMAEIDEENDSEDEADKVEKAREEAASSDVAKRYPWLQGHLKRKVDIEDEEHDDSPAKKRNLPLKEEEVDDDFLSDALSKLELRRAEWEEEAPRDTKSFEVFLRGGTWTAKHKKAAYDEFRAQPCTADARDFCRRYGLRQSFSASVTRYGEDLASKLCVAWTHKVSYFFELYMGQDDFNYDFSKEEYDGYVESLEYLESVCGLDVNQAAFLRVMEIRNIRPALTLRA